MLKTLYRKDGYLGLKRVLNTGACHTVRLIIYATYSTCINKKGKNFKPFALTQKVLIRCYRPSINIHLVTQSLSHCRLPKKQSIETLYIV